MVLPNGATIAPLPPPLSDEAPAAQAGSAGRGSQSARSNHPGGNKIRSGHCGGAARAGAVGFRAAAGRVARSARPAAARRRVRVPGLAASGPCGGQATSFFRTFSGLEFGTFIHLFPPHLSGSHHLVSLHPRCTPRRATVSRAPSRLDSSRPDGTRGRSAFRSRHCTAHLCRRPRSVWPHNVARSALASSHRMRFVSR